MGHVNPIRIMVKMAGVSKKQLDGGISGSLFIPRFRKAERKSPQRAYPQLRKAKDELKFEYRLAFVGLPEDKAKHNFPCRAHRMKGGPR